ncbi:unnamed protein product [Leuciscus chuanchicus]
MVPFARKIKSVVKYFLGRKPSLPIELETEYRSNFLCSLYQNHHLDPQYGPLSHVGPENICMVVLTIVLTNDDIDVLGERDRLLSRLSWGLYAPSMLSGTQESQDPLNPSGSVTARHSRNRITRSWLLPLAFSSQANNALRPEAWFNPLRPRSEKKEQDRKGKSSCEEALSALRHPQMAG